MPAYTPVGVEAQVKNFGNFMRSLNQMNKGIQQTGKATDTASKRTGGFGKSVLSVQSALAGLGLAGIVSQFGQFAVGAFNASAAAERLGAATDNLAQAIGSSGEAMVNAITSASKETISKTAAMTAANKAMMFGLVENEDQMGRLTEIAITLGGAMGQDAAKSLDDLTTALGRQSPMILDNLGITLKLEEAYRIYADQLGKTVDALTEEEKKQAFVNAALIKGEERVKELGGVTVDTAGKTEQLSAAWSDFTVAFGDLLGTMAGGIDSITEFVRQLETGAQSWKWIIDTSIALDEAAASSENFAARFASGVASMESAAAIANPLVGLIMQLNQTTAEQGTITAETTKQIYGYGEGMRRAKVAIVETDQQTLSYGQTMKTFAADYTEATKQIVEETIEAANIQREMMNSLRLSQAGYYNSLREYQESAAQSETDFNARMAEIRGGATEAQKEAATALSEELEKIEQEKQDKLHWVMTGAHDRTAEQNAADLAYWAAHYDELKVTAEAKTREKTDAILAEQSRAESAAAAAREKEKAEMAAHLEELKLKTVLAMMETTGQLEQMTGLIGISAGDAAELISAGVLPVTQEMGMAIQDAMGSMESSMAAASETATANQEILQAALGGTLTGTEELGTGMTNMLDPVQQVSDAIAGIGGGGEEGGDGAFGTLPSQIQDIGTEFSTNLPTNIATTDEALLLFSESALLQLQPILDKVIEINDQFLDAYSIKLPALQQMTVITSQVMVTGITTVNTVLTEMNALIVQITVNLQIMGEAAKTMIEEMQKISDVFSEYKELISLVREAAEAFDRLSTMAQKAADSIRDAGQGSSVRTGIGFHTGLGLQAGMGANTGGPLGLGYRIPPGYPNDTFGPLFVQSGEEMLVTPRGMSIEGLIFSRLASLMGNTTTNNNFDMTVNTGSSAQAVTQQFEVMRALVG